MRTLERLALALVLALGFSGIAHAATTISVEPSSIPVGGFVKVRWNTDQPGQHSIQLRALSDNREWRYSPTKGRTAAVYDWNLATNNRGVPPAGTYQVRYVDQNGNTRTFATLTIGGTTTSGPICGNGITESGEQCDDGNKNNGDGCSSSCQTESANNNPICGNGITESGEECDDGNNTSGDGCSVGCLNETSNDGCNTGGDTGGDTGSNDTNVYSATIKPPAGKTFVVAGDAVDFCVTQPSNDTSSHLIALKATNKLNIILNSTQTHGKSPNCQFFVMRSFYNPGFIEVHLIRNDGSFTPLAKSNRIELR